MKGTIRFFLGFLVTFGAVGGIEASVTDGALLASTLTAVAGLIVMASGARALKENYAQ